MIALLILVAALYAALHFIWESILAPSIRLNIRFELFKLRDEARMLKIDCASLKDPAYDAVQNGLNAAIKHLYDIDIPLLVQCDTLVKNNPEIRERVEKRQSAIADADCEDLHRIAGRMKEMVKQAAFVNSGGWLLYLVPLAAVIIGFRWVCAPLFSVLYLPNSELRKLFPAKDSELEMTPA